jgi:hypothetical protein
MDRKLDGMFFLVKRRKKWNDVCISDMTDEEIEENVFKGRDVEYLKKVIKNLAHRLKDIGDQLDLMAE